MLEQHEEYDVKGCAGQEVKLHAFIRLSNLFWRFFDVTTRFPYTRNST
jgi:hypothetical protein